MGCNTALYAANTASQAITETGTTVNLGNVVRRFGCGLNMSGGNVDINAAGYYNVDVSVTVTATTAGTAILTLYKNGVIVPGATASADMAAAGITSFTIPAIVRTTCNCENVLTVGVSGVTGTINNAAVTVVKV